MIRDGIDKGATQKVLTTYLIIRDLPSFVRYYTSNFNDEAHPNNKLLP